MSKYIDGILGHAIGDAMGVPIEFNSREECMKKPLKKMVGFGTYNVPAGTWSDDTSLELAVMDSYILNKCFNYDDIMKRFIGYAYNGDYTPFGEMFDIGNTVLRSINNYANNNVLAYEAGVRDISSNGNGSLMRMLPVALYAYTLNLNEDEIIDLVNKHSSLTHGHDISKLGCYIYVLYVISILKGLSKYEAYSKIQSSDYSFYGESITCYDRILNNNIFEYELSEIKSSGYIVDSLEAVLWVVMNTDNYEKSIITAINLGNDTDTVGAITGSITGILYGCDSIPKKWLNTLVKKGYIVDIASKYEESVLCLLED